MSAVHVCVCGAAGGIGQPLSLLLKQQLPAGSTLRLLDVVNAPGVAVDLSHVSSPVKVTGHLAPVKAGEKCLDGSDDGSEAAFSGCDLVVIPAGVPRKPGMTRADLFGVNAGIVAGLVRSVAKYCPKAIIALITNPVNSMVPVAAEVLKAAGVYDKKRLFGVSTLDVVRTRTFVAEAKETSPEAVKNVRVVGGHSAQTMIPLLSQVEGLHFTPEEVATLTDKIQNAGTAVVEAKAGAGSATLSMAFAGAHFAMAIARALGGEEGIIECAYVEVDERHGVKAPYFALPVELGKEGAHKVYPTAYDAAEQELLDKALPQLLEDIKTGEEFGKSA